MAKTPYFPRNGLTSLDAAGVDETDATELTGRINKVSAIDGAKGVILRSPKGGSESVSVWVWAFSGAGDLLVYPPAGGKINDGAANAAYNVTTGDVVEFTPVNSTDYIAETHSITVAAGAAGTVEGSKATVADANKDLVGFRNLQATNVDAGESGTAGSVDVFPSTGSKGKVSLTAADSAGDTTTTLVNASQAGARTYTIPDAGASASFVMTEGAQTINGTKTIPAIVTTNIDAGASGTAGSVDVFPTTGSKGKLAITCTDQTGDTTVSLTAGAMAAARTITIPDPLAAAEVLLGSQAAVARTATADGTTTGTIADKGCLQKITVTCDDANKIIILPTPTPGTIVILYVGATGFELRTTDPATIAINGGTGAAAESAIPANTTAVMYCESATSWKGFQMGSDGTLAKVEVAA